MPSGSAIPSAGRATSPSSAATSPRSTRSRRTRETVRQQITRSAAAIAQGFITEMSPHLPQFDREILFRLIRRNVIPVGRAGLRWTSSTTGMFAARQGGGAPVACHVFASMFKIGLLGYVGMHPETAELVQFFRYPGEVPLDRNDVLPDAEQFLVHPSLDLLIGSYNPDYFRQLDKLNVIGADRPWRAARQTLFVLKGDVRGAGAIFQDPVAGASFPWLLRRGGGRGRPRSRRSPAPWTATRRCWSTPTRAKWCWRRWRCGSGCCARTIGCEMRFGGDAGFVELAEDGPGSRPAPAWPYWSPPGSNRTPRRAPSW